MVTFKVMGVPQPKGSTRAFVKNGRPIVTSSNPNLAKWEQLVKFEASTVARQSKVPVFYPGPVSVLLRFGFIRPASVSARKRPYPVVKPDLDKLTRATIDPLCGVFFADDAQVIQLTASKRYLNQGPAFVEITVLPVSESEA